MAPIISKPGFWPLNRLGYQEINLSTDGQRTEAQVPFSLPDAIPRASSHCYDIPTPRKSTCFIFRFHVKIRFSSPGSGNVYLTAGTNRRAASQIILRRAGNTTEWSTLNLIRGYETHTTEAGDIDVRDANYIQTFGLHRGTNTVDFLLENPDNVGIASVTILSDTGLEWTASPPGRARLSVTRPAVARVGNGITIRYAAERISGRDLENVTIAATPKSAYLLPDAANSRTFPVVRGIVRGVAKFHATRPGRFSVMFHMKSGTSSPSVEVPVRVSR